MSTVTVRTRMFPGRAREQAYVSSTPDRQRIAEEAADAARTEAPVLTGAYRDGIGVEVNGATVTIVDDDPLAFYKEFGTADTPAHATLITAASRHGDYSGMSPR